MNIKKGLLAACLCLAGISSNALATSYSLSKDAPFIASGSLVMIENTRDMWIELDREQFLEAKGVTSSNNYRDEHNTLLINAFAVDSESYRYSDSKDNRNIWRQANAIAQTYLKDKPVDIYCTETSSVGALSCIIFGRNINVDGEEVLVNYNRAIFEAGLSKYDTSRLERNPDSKEFELSEMQKIIIYSQSQAKKAKAGVWSRSTGLLDIKFEQ